MKLNKCFEYWFSLNEKIQYNIRKHFVELTENIETDIFHKFMFDIRLNMNAIQFKETH